MLRRLLTISGRTRLAASLAVCALTLSAEGCSRRFWRNQADKATYERMADSDSRLPTPLGPVTIASSPNSRFFDVYNPDRPPMPPDDPVSHELMEFVDGKHGYKKWGKNGYTPYVENPFWRSQLPCDERGKLRIDLPGAVVLARTNSREYQNALENIYLSALDVTFERFRFDSQYFFGAFASNVRNGTELTPGGSTITTLGATPSVQRLFANGGTFVAGIANNIVYTIVPGENSFNASSLATFSFAQPLLRFASRARVLERLTLAERILLANLRQMQRYQQGFFCDIASGANAGTAPSRSGGVFGSGLEGFTGVGSGFGGLATGGGGGAGTGAAGAATGAGQAGGFLGLLQNTQQISNQRANIAALQASLDQLEAAYEANRIDVLQVEQARQSLLDGQSQLLTLQVSFRDAMDNYKLDLGIPPDIELDVDTAYLAPLQLLHPTLTQLQDDFETLLEILRSSPPETPDAVRRMFAEVGKRREILVQHLDVVHEDFAKMRSAIPDRIESLRNLMTTEQFRSANLNPTLFDPRTFELKVERVEQEGADIETRLATELANLERLQRQGEATGDRALIKDLVDVIDVLRADTLQLSLIEGQARLQAINLAPIELTSRTAVEVARVNRQDWMNARASLINSWRLIEFNANALKSDLTVTVDGQVGTGDDGILRFRGNTGQLRFGIQYDAPITRVSERNIYRQSLIDYQRARRSYMQFTDNVSISLRSILRRLERDRINFEVRRRAIEIAITQVDLTQLRLNQPPSPAAGAGGQQLGATTARDLVSALSALLTVQNDLLSVYIDYQVQRMLLDRDLGTMMLDSRGVWIDPGRFMYGVPKDEELDEEPPALEELPTGGPADAPPRTPAEAMEELPGTAGDSKLQAPELAPVSEAALDAELIDPLDAVAPPSGNTPAKPVVVTSPTDDATTAAAALEDPAA